MTDSNPALTYLGTMLRDLRERHGINATEIGSRIGLSQPSISKLENGKSGLPTTERLMAYLNALDAAEPDVGQILRQWELAQLDPSSFEALRAGGLDNKQKQLASLEWTSRLIREFQSTVVPGLLQTPQYASGIFQSLGVDADHARRATVARSRRQIILSNPVKSFKFVLAEPVLHSFHGMSPEAFRQQLGMLIARAASPNVMVRILTTFGGWPVETASPFCIIDRRYVSEESTAKEIVETEAKSITRYESVFEKLWNNSLGVEESSALLQARISQLAT